ncbi:hypothetical protein K502DRAFT_364453 [Neoconidiobolus thromboides FSU 785]|nr:hypothetical protein K502DRAFT_364453 [Neoconidiobolus thromboides FSU 785]
MFKFNFSIDNNEENDLETQFQSITLNDKKESEEPIIHAKEYKLNELLPQVIELEGIRPLNNDTKREIINLVYKRYLSDIKLHLAQQDKLEDKDNEQDEIRTWIDGLDVVRHIYEGGFKTWESALDLSAYLLDRNEEEFKNKNIIELGCGSSIPSLTILRNFEVNSIHFSDYNKEVISWITLPNLFSNLLLPINNNEKEEEIEVDLNMEIINKYNEQNKFKAFYGDWETLPPITRQYIPNGYDILLTTETIYAPELIPKLYDTINKLLSKPNGIAYVAAKTMYFGVGGGTLEFKQLIESKGEMNCDTVFKIDSEMSHYKEYEFDTRVCYDLSHFRDLLKKLRKPDDNIILRLNTTDTKSEESCLKTFRTLSKAYSERDTVIKTCVKLVDGKLTQLREDFDKNKEDSVLKSHLYAEEAKLRWIKNEASVEEIIQRRSSKVFNDRCRIFDPKKLEL